MRYYIFDLDGTLLDDKHKVPQGTKEFLRDIVAKGYKLGILTGRHYGCIDELFSPEEAKIFDFLGTYNGARVDFKDHSVKHQISKELLKELQGDQWSVSVSWGDTIFVDKINHAQNIIGRLKPQYIKSLEEFTEDPFTIRLEFNTQHECAHKFKQLIKDGWNEKYELTMSTGVFILIAKKGISKASAIELLRGEEVIFFGDSHNDLPVMELDWVTSVAPASAYKEVKNKADIILETTNNETLRIDL